MKAQLNWLMYWHIKRRARNAGISLIFKLPKRVVYWCVVRAAVKVEPNSNPENVTAKEMLEIMEYSK